MILLARHTAIFDSNKSDPFEAPCVISSFDICKLSLSMIYLCFDLDCKAWLSVSVALFIIALITWLLWSYFKISTSYLQSNCEMFNGEPRNTVDWWKQRNLVRQKTGNKSNIQNLIFQMISRGKKLDQVVLGKSGPLLEIQKYHMIKYRYILLSLVCESKIEKTCWSTPFRRTSPSLDLVLFMIKISRVPKKEFFSSKLQRVSSSHLHLQIVSSNLPSIWNQLCPNSPLNTGALSSNHTNRTISNAYQIGSRYQRSSFCFWQTSIFTPKEETFIQQCNDLDDFVCSKSSQSVLCIED